MKPPRADVPITTGVLAKLLGWTRPRTNRWLDAHAKRDATIIVWVNGRRMVTLASLRRVVPDIARAIASKNDFEELRSDLALIERHLGELAESHREFRRISNEWFRSLAKRVNALEKSFQNGSAKRSEASTSVQQGTDLSSSDLDSR